MIDKSSKNQSLRDLFSSTHGIRIPNYQRSYSWEDKHCIQFLEDLVEQNGKHYYLGQLLFEVDNEIRYIIDGQQRLTTSVILISAITRRLKDLELDTTAIASLYLTDYFQTIRDDQILFKKCTRKYIAPKVTDLETLSQKRIVKAYNYFYENLPRNQEAISKILEALEGALITTFHIDSKVEATQVFEYQNNRGKDLSQFEVIKAYLMHQIYIQADTKSLANYAISDIESMVSKIYRNMESTENYFSESELLNITCNLSWSIKGNVSEVKEALSKSTGKIDWITGFFEMFEEITDNAKSVILNKRINEISNLFFVGNEVDWKIILIAIFNRAESDTSDFKVILKNLEILCFKMKLGDFRTDYLPKYAKSYFSGDSDISTLSSKIENAATCGFKWYWNDGGKFENIIINYFENEDYHYNRNVIKFILWQYENSIRATNKSGVLLDRLLYDEYTIEHIAPQTPSNTKYSDEFKNLYLHKAGNLALLTKSQNSKFNNKSFEHKKSLFQDTALSSYTEIRNNKNWTESEIQKRHSNLVTFINSYFYIRRSNNTVSSCT
ncbi:DUF262 domain-containing protein [Vibrio sp. J383]|uniref:DUF262 domain-containing protein n=1 Tax=Vibrio sp. J383 TaxID=2942997 RepID=UPI0020BE81AD|nr:DUF262 domain-containing protein [Vibrio sp. J383]UQV24237.1 DUF262 domain-containing HNH endonuclease family protein [Vibrio sp. J383]